MFVQLFVSLLHVNRAGAADLIAARYPGYEVAPEKGFNIALEFDLDRLENRDVFLKNICELRRNVFGGPFHRAFTALAARKTDTLSLFRVEYRPGEMVFVCPGAGKVVVIFLVDFKDRTDKALAKLILTQFAEIRTTEAPVVSYSKEPPGELAGQSFQFFGDTCGFISFAFEERHVTGARLEQAVSLLAGFRNYIHYHIKCAKTYLHIRMRKRVAGWLQILNRAKPEVEDREMKTADGKTFTRAGTLPGKK
jgi:actin related protein 2/3 complex subunit 2